jgi:hypothetical protein
VFTREQLEEILDNFNEVIRTENAKPPEQKNTNLVNNLTKITEQSSKYCVKTQISKNLGL